MGSQRAQLINPVDKAKLLRTFKALYSLLLTSLFKHISFYTPCILSIMNLLIFSMHSRLFCVTYIQSQFISNPVLHIAPLHCHPLLQTNITHPAGLLISFLAWSASPWRFLRLTQHLHNPQSTFLNHASNKSYLCGLSFFGDQFNAFNTKFKAIVYPERCFMIQLLTIIHSASCVVCFCVHML